MGRGNGSSGFSSLLRRKSKVTAQEATCNQLVQEAQTGNYGNVLEIISFVRQSGGDDFWTPARVDVLRQEFIYDLVARSMVENQANLKRILATIDAAGLEPDEAKSWTSIFSARLRRHLDKGLITNEAEASQAARIEFVLSLSKTLAAKALEREDEHLQRFLGAEAFSALENSRSGQGPIIELDDWHYLFSHLLVDGDEAEANLDKGRRYLLAKLTQDNSYLQDISWGPLPQWTGPGEAPLAA